MAGSAAVTGTIKLTWPMATVAVAYIVGQTVVDTCGNWGAALGKKKRGVSYCLQPHRHLPYVAHITLVTIFIRLVADLHPACGPR